MDLTSLLIFLALGAATGWLAGAVLHEGGFGLLGNILIGVIGGVVGGYLFRVLAIAAGGLIGSMVTAITGAVALLFLLKLFKKTKA
ncbi:GlsB/YeaQ/YmgE family stress response membrane protein [Desulfofustis limnaeus]|jgi:uncharacterized membrane protein YeaQ/YmgE (transglycosylase-associated protein family)|uniref:GlsB/YeaQ/YmgE family stress response membrane protein n=1 Tax=Desulfofustis limnaeus TaxID=2740163 RepID=A0ABM7WAC5_9BACT|nr:GlsB/YeaQ/YmgE family stress response membrane protein [Desulfofustis limnaeus]BDD87863.1 hypothetical protein DPPLL_22280 [Desulfofustis limnaeus]